MVNKGDLFTVYMDGTIFTVCVIGSYQEDYSGEEMVILAIVSQENLVHVPQHQLDIIFNRPKFLH